MEYTITATFDNWPTEFWNTKRPHLPQSAVRRTDTGAMVSLRITADRFRGALHAAMPAIDQALETWGITPEPHLTKYQVGIADDSEPEWKKIGLISVKAMADELGITDIALGRKINRTTNFPRPIEDVSYGRLWRVEDVQPWMTVWGK